MSARRVEPRYYPRFDLPVPLPVVIDGGGGRHEARLVNLSEGGALARGAPALVVGEVVGLTFTLEPQGETLRTRAKVVRSVGSEVALIFDELAESAMASIRARFEALDPMAWDGGGPLPRELAVRFVPVIRRQAYRLARRLPASVSVEDLVGAGFVALVEASRRFDPSVGACFEAFALVRIRGAMLDELRGADPLSRGLRRRKVEVDAAAQRLTDVLGRAPDDAEIALHLDLSLEDYRACLAAVSARREVSLDELTEPRDSMRPRALIAAIASRPEADVEEGAGRAETLRRVETALAALPPRLRSVLEMYFGEELTMSDIGGVLGLTEGRISQLVSEGVGRLRARFAHSEDAS
ncbi:MAG: FliA/WhiG family RNA polymerase sigma factor [Polyangiales bacterium]